MFRAIAIAGILVVATASTPSRASTCPFDTGGSDAINDGIVLTRYALGITGAPLVASTRYASLDPLQVKNNIECVGCALDMNGDGQVDTVDTTIIARHLAGFKGSSVTTGLVLGAGTRSTAAAVTSFLANGCAVGGAINAFVQNGNAFGAPAVLGTTDSQPLIVTTGASNGLRLSASITAGSYETINTINGSSANTVGASAYGATISGGGAQFNGSPRANSVTASFGVVGGGLQNTAGSFASIGGGSGNLATATGAVVGGGISNEATARYSVVSGGAVNRAVAESATVVGGSSNAATAPGSSVTGGTFGSATFYGQQSHAAGAFNALQGSAQASEYVLRTLTSDDIATELFLDGSLESIAFAAGRVAAFDVQLVGQDERTNVAVTGYYSFRCLYGRNATQGAFIRPALCNKTVVHEDEPLWDANVSIGTNNQFAISVNGVVGQNVRWVATIRATEVANN
jgi:hypothetical protein